MSSTRRCKKSGVERLGWNVLEAVNDESKVLKEKVWIGGKDKNVLVRHLMLPNANSAAEENKCAVSKDTFWVWELFATDPYRRPTSNKAKSPYYFSYAFHHDGVVMAKFSAEDKKLIFFTSFFQSLPLSVRSLSMIRDTERGTLSVSTGYSLESINYSKLLELFSPGNYSKVLRGTTLKICF
ncbi:uncharacterized protein TNCT_91631 [Trichonephila clavata]|uniref:Uncharacterized protein n=1 Tax=Trichonephila clavata TaxID=2740835 RepID=A0A8X6F306_TRICU|nr:uncharacterized protein TNCT_91631 [Trichonephila clavata]